MAAFKKNAAHKKTPNPIVIYDSLKLFFRSKEKTCQKFYVQELHENCVVRVWHCLMNLREHNNFRCCYERIHKNNAIRCYFYGISAQIVKRTLIHLESKKEMESSEALKQEISFEFCQSFHIHLVENAY